MSNYIFPLTPGGSGGGGGGTSDTMWRPNVDNDGNLTWSRSTSTTPPASMNINGEKGEPGDNGKSAYEIWLDAGNTGTEQDFLDSLKGEKGADGTMSFDDLTEEQKESLNGFSPTITPNPDNTDDVYKLDITTKDSTFTTPNLKGGDEVTKYTYEGTGNLAGETYYSYEDLSTKIGETVEVTVSNRYGEIQDTLTIISKISDTELEVDNGAWIDTIMLTNTQTISSKTIDDARTSTTSTWSSTKIKEELDNVFDNLTEDQKAQLKGEQGEEGKSAYQIWLDEGNTGTEEEFLESLKGDGADVELDDVPTENSDNAIKSGAVYEALEGKQDYVTGGVSGQFLRKVNNSEPSRFEWVSHSNFVITGEVAFDEGGFIRGVSLDETYSLAKYAINKGQAVLCSLQDKNDLDTWYHLSLVRVSKNKIEFEGHLRKEDSIDTVYFSMDSNENYTGKRYTTEYMPKVTGTYGQIIGFDEDGNCIAKEEGEATKPYVVKMYYTLTDNQFQAIPASRTATWADWYPFYEAGGEVILELHKDSVDSGDDIIRLYAHSKGIYNKTYNTLEVQFTAIGETTTYGNSDHTKYLYVCWWQSGNSCKVNRYKINEIPTGGTTGQALVKKSDINGDVQWIDMSVGGLVVTGNYLIDDDDNWTVSNISETFANIDKAISDNQDVVLKIYPEGDTTNPYILYPAMHYANMGTAFSLVISDEGQISGLSVMITADNQVVASRNEYNFTEFCNKTELDERLGGKEVKIINNQFGDVTKLFRITDAPAESGKGYTVKLVAQRKNATIHSEYLSVSRVSDTYTYDSTIELQERNGSTGESTTMENSNFLIVDANHEVWAHIPSYTYAYVELISPNVKGTFVIDGSEGEFAEDAVLDTFSKRETDAFAKKGDLEKLKKSVSDGKTLVAGAITNKGFETAADAEFATMAENIGKIEAPVVDFKLAEGTTYIYSTAVAVGSNTIVAWINESIYYSEDGGATWNVSSLKDTGYGNTPAVRYAKEYDVFVVLVPYTNHGIYVSTDGGKTWTLKMGYNNVNTLRYSDGIFVGCSSTTTSGGITYSMDGVNWSLNSSFSSKAITNLSCVNGRWFFVANGTTYTSVDGYNWTGLTSAAAGSSFNNIKYYQGLWIANGSNSTIFYSTDGVTWNVCTFNWSNTQYGTSIQSMSRVGNNYVASTYNGMYYSTDRGKTWNPSNITTGNHSFKLFKGIILAIGAGGPSGGKGVYTSADGKTWTQSTLPNTGTPSSDMFFKGGKALITANDGALYSSTDGSTWEYVSGGRKIIAEFNGILLTNDFNYSVDGVNWKRASIDATIATTYWLGGNFILTHSNETAFKGLYYSKAYFS